MSIYVIAVRDVKHCGGVEDLYSYIIVADNQQTAEIAAIQKQIFETRTDDQKNFPMPQIEHDLCYEITCASDINGNMYEISCQLVRSARPVSLT